MVSKSQIKLITSLQQKKYRDKEGLFIAEGPKVISELREAGLKLHSIFSCASSDAKISGRRLSASQLRQSGYEGRKASSDTRAEFSEDTSNVFFSVTEAELQKISVLKTANKSLAIFEIPKQITISSEGLVLALDAIRDPGNLGTIIRLCDWFGITELVCSLDTADCYNPKVIQATMGSIARVHVHYLDLAEYLSSTSLPIYGGVLNGENLYASELPKQGIIVMGNEANGISEEIIEMLTNKITIPQFGVEQKTESLNVATATAILLSEFRRTTET